jgi:para-aminobenzoate synthetase component 1
VEAVIAAVARRREPAVLDSADAGPGRGRFTIAAFDPVETAAWHEGDEGPFEGMRERLKDTVAGPTGSSIPGQANDPGHFLGWIGYFAYEAGRYIEPLPATTRADIGLPVARFALYDTAAVHDALTGQWVILSATDRLLAEWRAILADARPVEIPGPPKPPPALHNMTYAQYLQKVARAREYLAAGDIFQVNFARRETFSMLEPVWRTYLRLRRTNPAAYAAFLAWQAPPPRPPRGKGREDHLGRGVKVGLGKGGKDQLGTAGKEALGKGGQGSVCPSGFPTAILSASPELFLRLAGREVMSRPIKGTRPRSSDPAVDAAYRAELAASPKDRAELAMIVDLVRNDLGRVCEYGSVKVISPAGSPAYPYELETHPTVHHLVCSVAGRLAEGRDAIDLVRACFPGGSITGAPKVRAMQIIDELEPTQRSVYTGAIGMFGLDGSMTLNIAIRTIIAADGQMHVYAGGGIVADSVPEDEYEETRAKARGMWRSMGVLSAGL